MTRARTTDSSANSCWFLVFGIGFKNYFLVKMGEMGCKKEKMKMKK